ncbi:MAG: GspH/FimT family pseudopilin [Pseudomonadota bacterium]|nr:GspH/FimT family pseudopilin [Pseudomonadota bacterium]
MNKQHGFTLVELIMGLAIIAIVLTLGVPSFNDLIRNNRMTTQVNQLVSALTLARSEAIKRGASIDVSTASGGANWKNGWSVEVSVGGADIRVFEAQKGDHSLVSDNNKSSFVYDSQGFLSTDCAGNCTITLCNPSGGTGRRLSIAPSGHVSVNGSYVCP